VTDEGWVNVRIQDPVTTTGKNATFTIQNEKVARYIPAVRLDQSSQDTSWLKNVYV